MSALTGFALLLAYQLVGEVLAVGVGVPIPGPVIGMLLLLLTLVLRRGAAAPDAAADTLLSHLSLLFVPAGVGVMVHAARLQGEWLPIVAALVVSTLVTLVVTALVLRWLVRRLAPAEPADGQ
ncbi:MAG TPA: CidA/LrgA family protein [Gammaproteobacteria bacterium]